MSVLADLPEIAGFFSYSREDDAAYKGRLSALRAAIQDELGAQLGRSKRNFRLWQDQEAIPVGTLWESQIQQAVEQAVFFIPIVTPRAINSQYCRFEFDAFLGRERALGRNDLVFPILYVPVPALDDETQWRDNAVLSCIAQRQYVDWQTFRHADTYTSTMREAVAEFARDIVSALNRSPAAIQQFAETDRQGGHNTAKRPVVRQPQQAAPETAGGVLKALRWLSERTDGQRWLIEWALLIPILIAVVFIKGSRWDWWQLAILAVVVGLVWTVLEELITRLKKDG